MITLDEKIGQLFVAPAAPLQGGTHFADWDALIKECHVANVLLKASDAKTQIAFLQRLQSLSKFHLLVVADAEWGLGMRMVDAISFPRNLTLGAVQDLSLIEMMGRCIGKQAKQAGIHLNLAPVVDVNINSMNPIIHMRSLGQDPHEVARRCCAIIRGMQKEGLLTCAKHFPGHGDTVTDSHLDLPMLSLSIVRLNQVELIPFQAAIDAGVDGVMSAHILVDCLDTYPASMSPACMQKLLRESMGFQGLAITDALNMHALTNTWSVEEIAIRAFEAGHDFLLYGAHLMEDVDDLMQSQIPRAFRALREAFLSGRLSIADLDARVNRILAIKERCLPIPAAPPATLMDPEALLLKRELFRQALTIVGQPATINESFVYMAIGGSSEDWIVKKYREEGIEVQCLDLQDYQIPSCEKKIVAGLHRVKGLGGDFGLSNEMTELLQNSDRVILFCTPYVMQVIHGESIVVAYENDPDAQEAAYDAIQGKWLPLGRLPIQVMLK
ncbi:MAG: Glyco-hydro-3-superfamily-like protein [Parachlamydiales bacterium]|nr:Glyco-hydro-3-superfamily-like protein [Parachlamydiales bacterium]